MRPWSTALACALVAAVAAPAASPGDAGGPNPAAPPETAQFGFLVGDWDCTVRQMKPDGSGYTEGQARWTGYWILGGFAVQDDWESPAPGGGVFRGTNIRSFNAQTGKWDNRWLPASTLQWTSFVATKKGDTMVMIGGEGKDAAGRPYVDRNTFSDIGRDSFKWRKDRSFDGGATWLQGVSFIEARRTRTAP